MRKGLILSLLWLLMALPSMSEPAYPWSPDLSVTYSGRGLESGAVLDIKVVNRADSKRRVTLAPLTVLTPANAAFSPILLESSGAWDMLPKGEGTFRVMGYALEHGKRMPGKGENVSYTPSQDPKQFTRAKRALQVGLQVEAKPGFDSRLLGPEKHRWLVLQRLIWLVSGESNPKTPQQLEKDLTRSFGERGKPPSEKTMKALTAAIWSDVEKCQKQLQVGD